VQVAVGAHPVYAPKGRSKNGMYGWHGLGRSKLADNKPNEADFARKPGRRHTTSVTARSTRSGSTHRGSSRDIPTYMSYTEILEPDGVFEQAPNKLLFLLLTV
jgi:hypothetical protein